MKKELYVKADSNGIHFSENITKGYYGHIYCDRRISIEKGNSFSTDNMNIIYKIADHENMFQSGNKDMLALCPLNANKTEQYSIEKIDGKDYLCCGYQVISEFHEKK